MVSLEDKVSYLQNIYDTPKLKAFHYFLIGKKILIDEQDSNENNLMFFNLINSILNDDKIAFLKEYDKKSKSSPSKEFPLPFVHDDFLLFVLIEGIMKFGIDKSWIHKILSIRQRNAVTITFENLLNENYLSKSNTMALVLIHSQFNQNPILTDELLNDTFKEITNNAELLSNKNDFQILCAFQAYDIIILNKTAPERSDIMLLNQFNKNFLIRIKFFTWIVQAVLLFFLIYILLKASVFFPEYVELVNKYGFMITLLGTLGITSIGNLIPIVKTKSQEFVMLIFGYPKELTKRNKN